MKITGIFMKYNTLFLIALSISLLDYYLRQIRHFQPDFFFFIISFLVFRTILSVFSSDMGRTAD